MTTHLTGFDLVERIKATGMQPVIGTNDASIMLTFISSEQAVVSKAQAELLLEQGFTFANAGKSADGNEYSMILKAPGNGYPERIKLVYRHETGRKPWMALCYLDDGKLVQFTRTHRWTVHDETGTDARDMLQQFRAEVDSTTEYWWIPVLRGSKIAHL